MSSGKAQFSGSKTVTVDNVDSRVKEVLKRFIPVLFDEDGNEHEDYALASTFVMPDATSPTDKSVYGMTVDGNGILSEIQGAVWMASRTITDLRKMNSAADTKRELHILSRGNWISELEAPLTTRNINRISDEAWWAIVEQGGNPITPTGATEGAKRAENAMFSSRQKNQDIEYAASMEMTVRVITSLAWQEHNLRIKIVTYSDPRPPTAIVELLKELGEIAGIFRASGVWRNNLAKAKKTAIHSSLGQ
ncbi:MAG: hypothetical protein ABTQ26_12320 [Azonexus sp.]